MKLIWDVTNYCNLNCKHCGAKNSASATYLSKSKAFNLIDVLDSYIDEVDLLGGEPLLYPYIFDVLERLTAKNISINLITNGQFEGPIAEKVLTYPIKSIFVSFEGLKEENDFVRGKGSWDKAFAFLVELIRIKKMQLKNTTIGVNIVLNKRNQENVIRIIDFFDDKKVDRIQFNPLHIDGNAKVNQSTLYLAEEEKVDAYEKIAQKSLNALYSNVTINCDYPLVSHYLNTKYGTSMNPITAECTAFIDSIYANSEGICYPCRRWLKKIDSGKSKEKMSFDSIDEFLHNVAISPTRSCPECEFVSVCHPCPLIIDNKQPQICKIAQERFHSIIDTNKTITFATPAYFVEEKNRYFVYFPELSCKTEYTMEGYNILRMCEFGVDITTLSEKTHMPLENITKFLLQESSKGKLRIESNA